MESLIRRYFDDVRFVNTQEYIALRRKLFAEIDEDFAFLEGYQTMAIVAIAYDKTQVKFAGKGYGMIARYAYGEDYHKTFYRLFDALEVEALEAGFKIKGYADVSPVDERFLGYLGGLGFIGHNDLLIHPTFGTYMMLGTILIDQAMTQDAPSPLEQGCGTCTKCIDACPGGALSKEGFIKEHCVSYQSQMKDPLTLTQVKKFKTFIWGCDVCQRVCPKNAGLKGPFHPSFNPDEHTQLPLADLLTLSNKAFSKKYQAYAYAFRGGLVMKRNAIMLMYNQRLREHLPLIKETLNTYQHVDWFYQTVKPIVEEMEQWS